MQSTPLPPGMQCIIISEGKIDINVHALVLYKVSNNNTSGNQFELPPLCLNIMGSNNQSSTLLNIDFVIHVFAKRFARKVLRQNPLGH